jgi:hypothetical protein
MALSRVLSLLLPCALAACLVVDDDDDKNDTGELDSGPGDSSGGTDSEAACAEVTAGTDWAWSGQCPQMRTPCDIEVDGCSLTIDYEADGGMTMGMPYSATVEGDTITFADDNSVEGCTGTVLDADEIEGSCKGGCTYTLKRGR